MARQMEIAVQKTINWQIKNFTREYAEKQAIKHEIKTKPVTLFYENQEFRWHLSLFPNGDRERSKGHLSLYNPLIFSTWDFTVKFALCILKPSGEVYEQSVEEEGELFSDVGISRFVSHEDLFDGSMMSNNCLKLRVKITLLVPVLKIENEMNSASDFVADFCKIFEDDEISDAKLMMLDGKCFNVHKVVLMARSPVFRRTFTIDMREATENTIVIGEDVDSGAMKELLRFIYCNKVENLEKVAINLIYCAEKYEILKVKEICRDYFISIMKTDNIIEILDSSLLYSDMELFTEKCVRFLATHQESMSSEERGRIPPAIQIRITTELQRRNESVNEETSLA